MIPMKRLLAILNAVRRGLLPIKPHRSAIVLIATALVCTADPLVITFSGTGSGTLGTTPFSQAAFTFTLTTDTKAVAKPPCCTSRDTPAGTPTSLSIAGLAPATLTDNQVIFAYPNSGTVGLAHYNDGDMIDLNNTGLIGFDFTKSIGPVSGIPFLTGLCPGVDCTSFTTSAGMLSFYQIGRVTFSAKVSAAVTPTISQVLDRVLGGTRLTPGMPIQIMGSNLGSATNDVAAIQMAGKPAPAQFQDTGTLLSQIPVDAPLGGIPVTATYKGMAGNAFTIFLDTFAPAVIRPAGSVLSSFTDSAGNPVTTANPALPNAQISCIAIGLGPTIPPLITNVQPTGLAPTTNPVRVTVGIKQVQADFAGLAAGLAPGYYKVSFKVPNDAAAGNQQVVIDVGGRSSNSVSLPVGQPKGARLTLTMDWQTIPTGSGTHPRAGDLFEYKVSIANIGTDAATEVTLSDPLAGLTFEGGPAACQADANLNSRNGHARPVRPNTAVICSSPTLAAGSKAVFVYQVSAPIAGLYRNVATVTWKDSTGSASANGNAVTTPIDKALVSDLGIKSQTVVPTGGAVWGVGLAPTATPGVVNIATANGGSDSVSIVKCVNLSCGAPQLVRMPTGSNPIAVSTMDLDNDGIADFVVLNQGAGTVAVLLSSATGALTPALSPLTGNPSAIAVIRGSDGAPLLLAVRPALENNASGALDTYTWNGAQQAFLPAQSLPTGLNPVAIAIADVNGDGIPDVVVLNQGGGSVSVFLTNAEGTLSAATEIGVGDSPSGLALGDFNGDGNLDLAVTSASQGLVIVLLGDGTGNFTPSGSFNAGPEASAIVAGDFDGDGHLDLAITLPGLNSVAFLRGDGSGAFASAGGYLAGTLPVALMSIDWDGDGIPDLVVGNNGSQNVFILILG